MARRVVPCARGSKHLYTVFMQAGGHSPLAFITPALVSPVERSSPMDDLLAIGVGILTFALLFLYIPFAERV